MPFEDRANVYPARFEKRLRELKEADHLRIIPSAVTKGFDFSSNDYLGLSSSGLLHERAMKRFGESRTRRSGATGSRLISGNTLELEALEDQLSKFFNSETALFFGSGYEANLALISSIASRHDTLLYDEYVHASIHDGMRLSVGRSKSFRHNDVNHLAELIAESKGDVFVLVESLYSMDGDYAPLDDIASVVREKGAYLIVDEAHAVGVEGPEGRGLAFSLEKEGRVFARVATFGKAFGAKGAAVLGSKTLKEYLINHARPFIFSTAPDLFSVLLVDAALELVDQSAKEREELQKVISAFLDYSKDIAELTFLPSTSHIQGVVIQGNSRVLALQNFLQKEGFAVRAVRSPTVPAGTERIRFTLHSFNDCEEVVNLMSALKRWVKE